MKRPVEHAALGFRVKSGWAAAVLVADQAGFPRLCDCQMIHLSDPRVPATRQPYHAAMGKLETNQAKLNRRLQIVRRTTRESVTNLIAHSRHASMKIRCAGLVVGSTIEPASVANSHIRAHASEGRLFRTELEKALKACRVRSLILLERDAYEKASVYLEKSTAELRCAVNQLGQSAEGPWRAEQKLAALAAWIALNQ